MNKLLPNLLIHGDNIQASEELSKYMSNSIKLAYLDPPYCSNTANEHYSDIFEPNEYRNYIEDVVKKTHVLLAEEGYLLFQIDSNNSFMVKPLIDKIFGTENFRAQIIVAKNDKKRYKSENNKVISGYDCIFFYSKKESLNIPPLIEKMSYVNPGEWAPFYTSATISQNQYTVFNNSIKVGSWRQNKEWAQRAILNYEKLREYMIANNILISEMEYGIQKYAESIQDSELSFLRCEKNKIEYYIPPTDLRHLTDNWSDIDIRGDKTDFEHEVNEILVERIIKWLSDEEGIILDPFLGSGTTAVVASRCNRKWIGIEKNDYCKKEVYNRIKKTTKEFEIYEL